jgi:regulator of replication initiation timing
MASTSGTLATGSNPASLVPTPDPNISPRDRLAALLAQWKNIPAPATISQDDLHRSVGTLRIVINHIDQLYTEIQNLRAEASARPNVDIEALTTQLEELQEENTNLQANATRLRQDLDRANTTIDHLHQNPVHAAGTAPHFSTATHAPKIQNIPDPEKFSGDRKDLKAFLSQVRLKLSGNASMFPTLDLRLAYIASLVKGPAYAHIEEHILDGFARIPDVNGLLEILSTAFGDPDEIGTAEREMRSLRQKNSDFATYYAEFCRLMTILKWDTRARRAALREGLSSELKDGLVFLDEKEDLAEFVTQLQGMDNRIRARAQETKGTKARSSTTSHQTTVSKPSYPIPTKPNEPYFRPGGTVPMALDASRRISPEERERRMRQGLCLYCAGSGHFTRECPNRRLRPLRANATTPVMAPSAPAPEPSKNLSTGE